MSEVEDLEVARNEVLRKIGRNVLHFQQAEHLLKTLLRVGSIAGGASELESAMNMRGATIQNQTMGQLVGQFLEDHCSGSNDVAEEPEVLTEPHLAISFSGESPPAAQEANRRALEGIVENRNHLIHHLLPQYDPNSMKSCRELDRYLDHQREELLPEIEKFQQMIRHIQQSFELLGSFLGTEEGRRQFTFPWPAQHRFVELLSEVAAQSARPDGWVSLSIAGQVVRDRGAEDFVVLKGAYGKRTLKDVILATDRFEVSEEATEHDGVRVLYRRNLEDSGPGLEP
ncbi:MAG: hypothetical protein ACKJSK_19105 [Roseibacillus sp.]